MAQGVPEIGVGDLGAERFRAEIVPAARPVLMRGLLAAWPVVAAGRAGPAALAAYLKPLDRGTRVTVKRPEQGRIFYRDDLTSFNFETEVMTVGAALDALASGAADGHLALQSVPLPAVMPGFTAANPMPLLPAAVAPRLWLGNAVTVAAHYDTDNNLAAVAAGRRRFTLFAPDQVANLYPGPFELTSAKVIVSMVDFDAPDRERFPRFAEAEKAALVADLEPGDALFIPSMWWHHVRSLDPVNMLVNYWWKQAGAPQAAGMPALIHAMLAMRNLPDAEREAWRMLFDHFAFERDGAPGLHLPPERRGVQGALSREAARELRGRIADTLGPPRGPTLRERAKKLIRRFRG
ncbi:cupin-like domain-containing protein [Sphingomonas sp. LB-2]|uniref:cupin-like domain-containing protein n=1 Tax=Sphingomonas caeni TaxID=2984949 RepID=UPI00222FB028|nr:cupin-like domain-containing protein [Sphingomonas caeni]MCW3847164.1 cupin-like domain-containing protein [Sphingomonas caeni]